MSSKTPEPSGTYEVLNQLRDLEPEEFEYFVAALWEVQQWDTTVTDLHGDGGVDVVAKKENPVEIKVNIEAKHWEAKPVGAPVLRKYTLPRKADAECSVVVTSGTFTPDALDVAEKTRTKTINGKQLAELTRSLDAEALLSEFVRVGDVSQIEIASHIPVPSREGVSKPKQTELAIAISGLQSEDAASMAEEGIDDISDLAKAEPESVSEETSLSYEGIKRWVRQASYLDSRSIETLDGIGTARKENLETVGIESLGDLAVADPSTVTDAVDFGPDRAADYCKRASERPAQPITEVEQIGEMRGEQLRDVGIEIVADLVAEDIESIASEVDGVTEAFLQERSERA
jgi:hypothetical protein